MATPTSESYLVDLSDPDSKKSKAVAELVPPEMRELLTGHGSVIIVGMEIPELAENKINHDDESKH